MKTTSGQDLKKELEELYIYYFGEGRKQTEKNEDKDFELTERDTDFYMEGKFSGALDAVSAIYLSLFGGKETMQLWHRALAKFEKDETDDDKTTDS